MVEQAGGLALAAARSWMRDEVVAAYRKMKTCSPEELGQLQGRIHLAEKFLKIFPDSGECRPIP